MHRSQASTPRPPRSPVAPPAAAGWFWRMLAAWWLAVVTLPCAYAMGPEETFDAAAKLYEQGRPADAARAYQQLITNGVATPAVLFNQGNAWLQAGQVGRAIAAYRQAQRLVPRDADVQANLARARARIAPPATTVDGFAARALRLLAPNEWGVLALVVVWTWGALLLAGEFAAGLRARTGLLVRGLGVVALLVATGAFAAGRQASQSVAVVIAADSTVRFGPLEESQSAFTLPDGAELAITDRKGEWLGIRDGSGRVGWILARNVLTLP